MKIFLGLLTRFAEKKYRSDSHGNMGTWEQIRLAVPVFPSLMGTSSRFLPIKTLLVPMFPFLFYTTTTFSRINKKRKRKKEMGKEKNIYLENSKAHINKRYIGKSREHGNNGNKRGSPWEF
jgi:hypothetical protein